METGALALYLLLLLEMLMLIPLLQRNLGLYS